VYGFMASTNPNPPICMALTIPGEAFGAEIVCTKVDVSKSDQVEKWIEDTVRVFGRLDGAANVAGVAAGDGETTCQTIVSRVASPPPFG
jgi:NAD(P)-dependent dehydrogenase (short-subunit alcohol dehydrogenase family)